MKKIATALLCIFIALFIIGNAWLTICFTSRSRSNDNYIELQPESFAPDVIGTVLWNENLRQIYVCYSEANCVNVYSESGDFLWSVATPDAQNSHSRFQLTDNNLIIYNYDAYFYNSANGSFKEVKNVEDTDLTFDTENSSADALKSGKLYFDDHQVYRVNADGSTVTLVSRPWWHKLFNYTWGACTVVLGGIGIGLTVFLQTFKHYRENRVPLTNRKAIFKKKYYVITSIVHLTYAILNIALGFWSGILCIGILPLGIHLIISSCIMDKTYDKASSNGDNAVTEFWSVLKLGTFFVAFASVIVVAILFG